jgi:hypothetical protein
MLLSLQFVLESSFVVEQQEIRGSESDTRRVRHHGPSGPPAPGLPPGACSPLAGRAAARRHLPCRLPLGLSGGPRPRQPARPAAGGGSAGAHAPGGVGLRGSTSPWRGVALPCGARRWVWTAAAWAGGHGPGGATAAAPRTPRRAGGGADRGGRRRIGLAPVPVRCRAAAARCLAWPATERAPPLRWGIVPGRPGRPAHRQQFSACWAGPWRAREAARRAAGGGDGWIRRRRSPALLAAHRRSLARARTPHQAA